jgi:hypothetical protein
MGFKALHKLSHRGLIAIGTATESFLDSGSCSLFRTRYMVLNLYSKIFSFSSWWVKDISRGCARKFLSGIQLSAHLSSASSTVDFELRRIQMMSSALFVSESRSNLILVIISEIGTNLNRHHRDLLIRDGFKGFDFVSARHLFPLLSLGKCE